MRTFAGLLAASAMILTHGASATTSAPKVSGAYNLMTTTVCQASLVWGETEVDVPPFSTSPTTTDVGTIASSNTGGLKQLSAVATFAAAGTVKVSGTSWQGDLVYNGKQGPAPGLKPQRSTMSGTYSLSGSQLTFTFSGASNTYQVLHSDVVNGIANHLDLVNVNASTGCVEEGVAVHR